MSTPCPFGLLPRMPRIFVDREYDLWMEDLNTGLMGYAGLERSVADMVEQFGAVELVPLVRCINADQATTSTGTTTGTVSDLSAEIGTLLDRAPSARGQVDFDLAREEGWGAIVSVDLHGLFDLDEAEAIFDDLVREGEIEDEFGVTYVEAGEVPDPEDINGGAVMVEHCYRVEVALQPDDDGDYTIWDYLSLDAGAGRDDGLIVTRLTRDVGWDDRMCWQHPFEPAVTGIPVTLDYQRWARDGYLYCCRDCADQQNDERIWRRNLGQEHFELLKGRGLRETWTSRGPVPA